MKIALKALAAVAALAFLGVVMAALAGGFEDQIPADAPRAARAVDPPRDTVEAQAWPIPVVERAPGTMRAKYETVVSARITASLTTLAVRSGDSVERGQILAELDDRDLRARVSQAEREVDAIDARLVDAAADLERVRQLYESNVASRAELDRAQAASRSLEAERNAAEQAVEQALAGLSFARLEAPLDARVIDRFAEPGDIVAPGQPILRLYDPASLRLEADVRESLATTMRRGDPMRVWIDAIGIAVPATVEEIVPQSDAASRSFVVKVALDADALGATELYPGMFGRLLIDLGTEDVVAIPQQAVHRFGQVEFVYVVLAQGQAVRRFVRTARQLDGDMVEVVSGLEPGEVIASR